MDYIVLLGEEQEATFAEKVDVLHKTSFLSHCERREVQLLSYFMEQNEYLRRSVIALQGLPSNYLYIVYSGECAVVQHAMAETPESLKQGMEVNMFESCDETPGNEDVFGRSKIESDTSLERDEVEDTGNPSIMTAELASRYLLTNSSDIEVVLLGPGQYFGEREMLKGIPYENSLVAMSECKILRIHRDDCFSQMDSKTLGVLNMMSAERHKFFVKRMLHLTDPDRSVDFISKTLAKPKTPPDRTTLVEANVCEGFRAELKKRQHEGNFSVPEPHSQLRLATKKIGILSFDLLLGILPLTHISRVLSGTLRM